MAEKQQTSPKPPATSETASRQRTEDEKLINELDELILLYVFKKTTKEAESALSPREIVDKMNYLLPHPDSDEDLFSDKTMRRRLKAFASLENSKDGLLQLIFRMLPYVCGGEVRSCPAAKHEYGMKDGAQRKYYFAPLLSEGDMDMICGTVRSSRYLSEAEKNFLLARLKVLQPFYGSDDHDRSFYSADEIPSLPERPEGKYRLDLLPVDSSKFLSHIQLIHQAIRQNTQIQVTHGAYGIDERGRINFHATNPDRPYYLNPYAMMWNGGRYYLIATHNGHSNPAHFRMDRIMDVQLRTETNEKGETVPVKRAAVPELLIPFFKGSGNAKEFDATRYANTYPEMRIYENKQMVTCRFAYTPTSLQILTDYFGAKDLRWEKGPEECIRVRNVQYENALGFCVMMADHLTLLSPPELVADVRRKLSSIVKKYESS